jgi:hypothetical protein
MTANQLVKMIEQRGGTLELTSDGRIHYRLPAGLELLADALKEQKEQVRAILRNRGNQARPKKVPKQAPPAIPVEPLEPVYITPACRCSKYPFAHVHAPEPNLKVIHVDGDELFRWLKEQVTARQTTANDSVHCRRGATR